MSCERNHFRRSSAQGSDRIPLSDSDRDEIFRAHKYSGTMKVNEPSQPSCCPTRSREEEFRKKERLGGFLWRKPGAALSKKPSLKKKAARQRRTRESQVSV